MKNLIFAVILTLVGSIAKAESLDQCRMAAWEEALKQAGKEGYQVGGLTANSMNPQHINANTDLYEVTRYLRLITQNSKGEIEEFTEENNGTLTYRVLVQVINGQCVAKIQ